MKMKNFLLALLFAACSLSMAAQSGDAALQDKITQAVMKVYNEQLAKNPNDYSTLISRAHQYFYAGDYDNALADVNQALAITPAKEKDIRFDEYVLRGRIYEQKGDYVNELADLNAAEALNPNSLALTDLKAKANLKAGNVDAAEAGFKTILRSEAMNYDALYQMARVEVARNNPTQAVNYATQAVNLFTAQPQVYLNRADIFKQTGDAQSAAHDYINALALGNDGGAGMQGLFDLSDTNYDDVMAALADATTKAPRNGLYYYLRANVAIDHSHYGQALKDLKSVIDNNLYDYHSVYYKAAVCQMELTQYDDALSNINRAIALEPSQPEYYVLKSLAELYRGKGNNYDNAMAALNQAATVNPQSVDMLVGKAKLLQAQGKDKEALSYLNAAIAAQPRDAEALMMRGTLNKYKLNNTTAANTDFESVLTGGDDAYSLKGFALYELGRNAEATNWAANIAGNALPGGETAFYAAALMAKMGNNDLANDYLKQALDNGYGSLYEINVNKLPYVNIAPLRAASNFSSLATTYQQNFQER